MKKLLFSILYFFSGFDSFSQITSIDSFYMPGTVWVNNKTTVGPVLPDVRSYTWSHTIEHDSIINGQNYHLISGKDISWGMNGSTTVYNNEYGILGGIRVDGRKVYFLLFDTVSTVNSFLHVAAPNWQQALNEDFDPGVEKMIYDFDLQIGTSFEQGLPLLSVDSVLLANNVYAKRYKFSSTYQNSRWIEGIGGLRSGPLSRLSGWPEQNTICYYNPSMQFSYPDPNTNCASYSNTVAEAYKTTNQAVFYPNPMENGLLQIATDRAIDILTITDISGKLLEHHSFYAGQNSVNISVPSGIYFIKLQYKDGSSETQKLVKH